MKPTHVPRRAILLSLMFLPFAAGRGALSAADAASLPVGVFSGIPAGGMPADWQEERFSGRTIYRAARLEGIMGLGARAEDSASGLYREIAIDLEKTPVVTWSWALEEGRAGLDPRRKAGDDYPLRLYFVVKRGPFNLNSIALQYVWSLSQPTGSHWTNPFADGVKQLAIDSGPDRAGRIQRHRRNLRDDFRVLFGEDVTEIDVVAIMTDADNAGGVSAGWYGDITFTAE